jgi:hypothetical protein
MGEEEPNWVPAATDGRGSRQTGLHWGVAAVSAMLVLSVAFPTMAVEEDWHGHPMIDQGNHLWLVAGLLVAACFVAGGAVAGRLRPFAAAKHAAAAATLAVVVLLVAAVSRRVWVAHEGVPMAVVGLWCLGTVASLVLAMAGAHLGRRSIAATPNERESRSEPRSM